MDTNTAIQSIISNPRRSIYRAIAQRYRISTALYPGCGYDLAPSLYIPEVVYIDNFKEVAFFFHDREKNGVLKWINENKKYPKDCHITFYDTDYQLCDLPEQSQYELLISQYAGDVGQIMKRYLRLGGVLLVAEGPDDARLALEDPEYELLGTVQQDRNGVEVIPGVQPPKQLFIPQLGEISMDRNFCFRKY